MNIREANLNDAASIAKIKIETWCSTYRGLVPDEVLEQLSHEKEVELVNSLLMSDNGTFCFVAETNQGETVGYAFAGPERTGNAEYKGEIYAIYILERYQGEGFGNLLFQFIASEFCKMGIYSLTLWVLADNPYCRFYERLTGNKVDRNTFEVNGANLELVAYGWSNLDSFLAEKQ